MSRCLGKSWNCYVRMMTSLRINHLFFVNDIPGCYTLQGPGCYTLSGRIGKMVASHDAVARSIPLRCTDLYYARGAQGVLPMRMGGATSQLDLPSLTPLSVAGCG